MSITLNDRESNFSKFSSFNLINKQLKKESKFNYFVFIKSRHFFLYNDLEIKRQKKSKVLLFKYFVLIFNK